MASKASESDSVHISFSTPFDFKSLLVFKTANSVPAKLELGIIDITGVNMAIIYFVICDITSHT